MDKQRADRTYQSAATGTPITDLPPKAQEIIRAAQRILTRDGFDKLSFEAIAAEAGVYTSAIRYYFGSKSRLVEALVDVTTHDASLRVYERSRSEPNTAMRVRTAVLESAGLTQPEVYQTTWEMLPHILRSKQLKGRVAKLYDLHRRHYDEVFAGAGGALSPETVRSYASLLIAVLDGIAIQKALDPEGVDIEAIFALWAKILSDSVRPNPSREEELPRES
jgi:AcrR family transcriptional regulator